MAGYMEMMKKQRGEDWIFTLRPEDIQNSTKRIVRDIAKGSINYEEFGNAFLDSKFIENLIIGITNELEINTLNYNACTFYYYYYPNTANIGVHIKHLERVIYIYNIILSKLNYVKIYQDIGCMADTAGLLFSDRAHLNNL